MIPLPGLPEALRAARERGIRTAITRELDRLDLPLKVGLGTGILVAAFGYRAFYQHDRWRRIERKLDRLIEEEG